MSRPQIIARLTQERSELLAKRDPMRTDYSYTVGRLSGIETALTFLLPYGTHLDTARDRSD
jgi:hypothetical protein